MKSNSDRTIRPDCRSKFKIVSNKAKLVSKFPNKLNKNITNVSFAMHGFNTVVFSNCFTKHDTKFSDMVKFMSEYIFKASDTF